ncbi:MAG: AAA family ATPase [Desulfovibrionaceae bacterium]|jgi:predicted ATPase|nr:AAA family ATPase [Desulfovibrionaceae bacterium]
MPIEKLVIKNYKAFRDAVLTNIPRFSVVVGANGTGKTTLFDVFGFLKDCLTYNVTRALQRRGGFKEVCSRGVADGPISIEVQFRHVINKRDRLVTYYLEIGNEEDRPVVTREILRYKRGRHGKPYHFLDFSHGKGTAIKNEDDFDEADKKLDPEPSVLDSPDILAVKGIGQFTRFKAANAFRQLLENWHVSDIHISDTRGSKDVTGDDEHLSVSGDNLQLVANNLFHEHREVFDAILGKMQRRVPGVTSVQPSETDDGRLLLKFQDGAFRDPFIDRYVSDGTMKMFAYLVLLHDPAPRPLLCVEEPENQLYPSLLRELAEEFREYAQRGGQVFVSTHSPDFLNAARLEEVFWLQKQGGYTVVRRANEDEQIAAYMRDGDTMGALWKQGLFFGADPA